jgi:hypothetical protein
MDDGFDNRAERAGDAAAPHLTPEQLSAYLDGDVAAVERTRQDAHLRDCPDCRDELVALRTTVVLLRGLPEYRPRRSFQLQPDQIAATRPWWERLGLRILPALPALRVATVAAALLLVAVSAGEVIQDRTGDEAPMQQPVPAETTVVATSQTTGAVAPTPTTVPPPTPTAQPVEEQAAAKAPTESDQTRVVRQAEPTDTPESGDGEGFGGVAAGPPEESTEVSEPAGEPVGGDAAAEEAPDEDTDDEAARSVPAATEAENESDEGVGDTDSMAMAAVADEASATAATIATTEDGQDAAANLAPGEPAATPRGQPQASPSPQPPTPVPASPTSVPATSTPDANLATPSASPAAVAGRQTATSDGDGGVSGWRIAQIGLVLLLLWLVVTVVGLQRLRGRR